MKEEPVENPMHRLAGEQLPEHRLPDRRTTLPLARSCPRCEAQTRAGTPCQSPAMGNGRCRVVAAAEAVRGGRPTAGGLAGEPTAMGGGAPA